MHNLPSLISVNPDRRTSCTVSNLFVISIANNLTTYNYSNCLARVQALYAALLHLSEQYLVTVVRAVNSCSQYWQIRCTSILLLI